MNTKQQLVITWANINKQISSIQKTINKIEYSAEIIPLAEKINILNQSIQSITIETLNMFCTIVTSINDDINAAISKWQCLKVEHRPKLALADRVLKFYPENFWKSYFVCINT